MSSTTVMLAPTVASAIATGVPVVVELVTKSTAPNGLKSAVNLAGVVVAAVVALFVTGEHVDLQTAFLTGVMAFVTSAGAYHFAWKPWNVIQKLCELSAGFGIGPSTPGEHP